MATEPVYERPVAPVTAAPPAPAPATGPRTHWASIAGRIVLTVAGAACLIVGGLLDWVSTGGGTAGTKIDVRALWDTSAGTTTVFVHTVGFVAIVLGLLAIVGLAFRSGWLTRIAGALGIVEFVLFAITVSRSSGLSFPGSLGAGVWVTLAGGAIALAGGFLGARTVAITTAPSATPATTTRVAQ
jgi:hypothetical protein